MTEATNRPPIADAGPDQTVQKKTLVTLDGIGSSDPDGDSLVFAWTAPAGVSLSASDAASPTFTALRGGAYMFLLTVGDGRGGTDSDSVVITVMNGVPSANAGADLDVQVNTPVTLDGRGSMDPDGDDLAFLWQQIGGPSVAMAGATTATAAFTPSLSGSYVFTLTVDDGKGETNTASVVVTVQNRRPRAAAGADQPGERGTAFTLDGRSSSDPDGDALTFAWIQEGGPTVALTDASAANPRVTPSEEGAYVFRLTVTDEEGATDVDTVLLVVTAPAVDRVQAPFPAELSLLVFLILLNLLLVLLVLRRRKREAADADTAESERSSDSEVRKE